MLARYTMYRTRPKDAGPLPEGIRQDSRWRTKHILRPTQEIVEAHLTDDSDEGWESFRSAYLEILEDRFQTDPTALARAITTTLTTPDLARRYGEAGRARVLARFSLQSMAAGYLRLYGDE